jgi:hypothetical protein
MTVKYSRRKALGPIAASRAIAAVAQPAAPPISTETASAGPSSIPRRRSPSRTRVETWEVAALGRPETFPHPSANIQYE